VLGARGDEKQGKDNAQEGVEFGVHGVR